LHVESTTQSASSLSPRIYSMVRRPSPSTPATAGALSNAGRDACLVRLLRHDGAS
jgi:hypothetical protein